MRFDFRDLELFVAVAEAGSIARAAERSHTVPSAISKRLTELEQVTGVALLVRGAKGVELTAAGHALLLRAKPLLQQAALLDDDLRAHATGIRGRVRVFANISAIVEFLPQSLATFLARHPEIQVHLEEHVSSVIAAAVVDYSADFGIVSELPAITGLECIPFRTDELVMIAHHDHHLAQRPTMTLKECADEPFIGLHAQSALQSLLQRAAMDMGKSLQIRMRVTSFDAVCAMVAAGLGVSIVPRAATAAYVRALQIVSVPLIENWAQRQLFICLRQGQALPSAAQLLVEHLRKG